MFEHSTDISQQMSWHFLRAGPLEMKLDPNDGFLRYVQLGNRELLRGIYVAVRDQDWNTVRPKISAFAVERTENGFAARFEARCRSDRVDFRWEGRVEGSSDGTLTYAMEGRALRDFLRNRIGICVLHPARECSGKRCLIHRPDGTVEDLKFPEFISPYQPFKSIRAMTHEVIEGVKVTVSFDGDTFETEDQRNWSDASFKTYSTPLDLPFPVRVSKGETVRQKVTLTLAGLVQAPPKIQTGRNTSRLVRGRWATPCRLPQIGLCVAGHGLRLEPREIELLRRLKLNHLRFDLDPAAEAWREAFTQACEEAQAIGATLHVAMHLSGEAESELTEIGRLASPFGPSISTWLIFNKGESFTHEPLIKLVKDRLQTMAPRARFSTGTNAYFAQLNRDFVPCESAQLVSFSLNPQVHTFDDASMIETLETQTQMILSCRKRAPGLPVAVSPISLRPRFNPNATSAVEAGLPETPPLEADPRQRTLFSAGWLLGSVCSLSIPGTLLATYFETTGELGIMDAGWSKSRTDSKPSKDGVFPSYHVLADLADLQDQEIRILEADDPLTVCGLVSDGSPRRCLIANLTPFPLQLELDQGLNRVRVRTLGKSNIAKAQEDVNGFRSSPGQALPEGSTFSLPPQGYVRVEEEL